MFWLLIKKALGTVLFFFGAYIGLIALFAEDLRRNHKFTLLGMAILSIGLLGSGVTLWNAKHPAANDGNSDEGDS